MPAPSAVLNLTSPSGSPAVKELAGEALGSWSSSMEEEELVLRPILAFIASRLEVTALRLAVLLVFGGSGWLGAGFAFLGGILSLNLRTWEANQKQ